MNGIVVPPAEETRRLTLALLLALSLHAALLLGLPVERWSLRHSRPLRLDVALLPPVTRPSVPAAVAAPEPVAAATQPASLPAVAPLEPAPPPLLESLPVAPLVPIPAPTPPPAPKPLAVTRPAPKPSKPPVPPTKPSKPPVPPTKPPAVAKITPAPRTVVKPVAPPPPAKSSTLPAKPAVPTRKTAPAEPVAKPPAVKPAPAPRLAPAKTFRPSAEPPPADRPARSGRSGTGDGRLNSAALLGQVAGLDAETQRQTRSAARERRVSLADSRSLAGFYAADWARKVTRIGEMNFPDAARRLNLSAGPLLEVAIRADGSLRDVRILRSSGNAELDQAARRIVQLAAPYPPFSPELRQQVELLRIEAPWRFDPGGRVQVR